MAPSGIGESSASGAASKHAAFYIGSLQMGGAERVMVNLAEALFARGWRVTFVTTYIAEEEYDVPHGCWQPLGSRAEEKRTPRGEENGDAEDGAKRAYEVSALTTDERPVRVVFCAEAEQRGIPGDGRFIGRVFTGVATAGAGGRGRAFRERKKRLDAAWDTLQPDVILSFIGKNNLMALMTAPRRHIPTVVSVRAVPALEYPGRLQRTAASLLFGRAAAVVMQTRAAADFFPRRVRERTVVVPNAVSEEFFADDETESGGNDREKTVVAVGRMDANKRFDLLLRAFAKICGEPALNEYQLLLYGDGEDRKKLEAQAHALGIAGRTVFMGRRRGIAGLIRHAGAYCLMSDTEGMPNTLIEALCLGIPTVTTDCVPGGIGQLVRDGEEALVVAAGDEDAFAAALKRLLIDRDLAARLSENAGKLRERHDPERVADLWEQILVRAADKGRAG